MAEDERKKKLSLLESYQFGKNTNKLGAGSKLVEIISDVGCFSFSAVIALSLNNLFNDEWNKEFSKKCLTSVIKHLQLPEQVKPTLFSLLRGEVEEEPFGYVNAVIVEPKVKGDPSILLQDCVLLAIADGAYDARWRVLIKHLNHLFGSCWEEIELFECSTVHHLLSLQREISEKELEEAKHRSKLAKAKRSVWIGLAAVGAGALTAITGGLAAPAIIPLIGLSSIFGTVGSTAIVVSLFGAAGAGLAKYKMRRRIGEIEEFEFRYLSPADAPDAIEPSQSQLHVTVAVSGWITDDRGESFSHPWSCLLNSQEQYYLRYESKYLEEFGNSMGYFYSAAITVAAHTALKRTILSGLVAAVAWPITLLSVASIIDNPWGVCRYRSVQVGKQLAEVLLSGGHGRRPVTLIGYSLGARVIYHCLKEMSGRSGCEGIVQDAVILGAPCEADPDEWKKITRVVAGRLVNGYCRSDWLLKFLYRTFSLPSGGVAGLQSIKLSDRRMCNIDLTFIVSGQNDYPNNMKRILKLAGVKVRDTGVSPPDSGLAGSQSDIFGSGISSLDISEVSRSESDFVFVDGDNLP